MRKSMRTAAAVGLGLTLTLSIPSLAEAHGPKRPAKPKAPVATVLTDQVGAPFNLAVSKGTVYIADGGLPAIRKLGSKGLTTIADGPAGGDVAGIAFSKDGKYLAYTSSESGGPPPSPPLNGALTMLGPRGSKVVADIHGYETAKNPDSKYHYGIKNPTQCQLDGLAAVGFPASYKGIVDAHPYSVAHSRGAWVVADAGANALFSVDKKGRVRTLAVLPPQPTVITQEAATALDLADCLVGATYAFESVPTDVEVGPGGWLYVTTLPGGPEGTPGFAARGSVYKVHPVTGKAKKVASGIDGATNLAIHSGKLYVTEFYSGQLSVISKGKPKPYLTLPGALSVESDGRNLYVGTLSFDPSAGPSTVVKVTTPKKR